MNNILSKETMPDALILRQEHLIADVRELVRVERPIRHFLLSESDHVRFTVAAWEEEMERKSLNSEQNPLFETVLKLLSDDFLSSEFSQFRYNGVKQPNGGFQHLHYRLSSKLKELLNRQTLLWGDWDWKALYGLEDPTFYLEGEGRPKMVGSIISHEPLLYLYLGEDQFKALTSQNAIQWTY